MKNNSPRALRHFRVVLLLALVASVAGVSFTTTSASSSGGFLRRIALGSAATAKAGARRVAPAIKKQVSGSSKQKQDEQRTTAELNFARKGHTATILPDGKILVAGGENSTRQVAESEIYDPAARTFSLSAKLASARADHTATAIHGGQVVLIGGRNNDGSLKSTELFDSGTNTFTRGPALTRARSGHTATVLADGRILIAGGDVGGTVEFLDPATMKVTRVDSRMTAPRSAHSAILLKSGKVLIAGGLSRDGGVLSTAEVFDPENSQFTVAGNSMKVARTRPTLRMLADGKVQVIGGDAEQTMEMFNAEGRYFTARARLMPESDSETSIAEVLRAPSRAALIQNHDSIARMSEAGAPQLQTRRSSLLENLLGRSETLTEMLDRSQHTITEIPLTGTALITGGRSSSGMTLMSATTTSSSSATVTTDKTDYAPGETVTISGTNWLAGETVQLRLHRDEQDPSQDTLLSAVADANGDIVNSEYVCQESDLGVTFLLTATGQTSGYVAQTTFTDNRNWDLTFAGTGGGSVTITPSAGTINAPISCGGTGTNAASQTVTGTCSPNITTSDNGATLTFSAVASAGSTFAGWSGATNFSPNTCLGTTNPCNAVAGSNASLTVTFNTTATAPTISCPANIVTNNDSGQCSASVPFSTTATGSPTPTVECKIGSTVIISPHAFPVGTTTVTCTATNTAGSDSCSFNVTVKDTESPTCNLPANITQNNDAGVCGAVVSYIGTASDNCTGATISCTPASGSNFVVGTTTVNCTASDASSDSTDTNCSFTVTVKDTEAPTCSLPPNITKNNDAGACGATVNYTATASDNCPGATILCTPASGTTFAVGTTTVNCTATDASPDSPDTNCSFTVTVKDTQAPTCNIPIGVVQNNAPGQCGAVVMYVATASDNCPGSAITCSPTSGSLFAVGATIVNCTASDASPDSADTNCSFTVTVKDVEAPTCNIPSDFSVPCTTSSGGALVTYSATASDNCPGASISCTPPSGSTFSIGTTTVFCTATDASTDSPDTNCDFDVTVGYNFTGFFQPVDNPPTTNIVKAGQSVPLKFQLTCGENFISDLSAVVSVQSVNAICDGGAAGDPIPADDSGSSGLHYDYVANQFIYSWKTQKNWANTCRRFILTLNDGSTHVAYFQFKK